MAETWTVLRLIQWTGEYFGKKGVDAAEGRQGRVVAPDIAADALAVAKANVEALGVAAQVELRQGDLFAPVGGARFEIIVSNPPYVAEGALPGLPREVQREPRLAL